MSTMKCKVCEADLMFAYFKYRNGKRGNICLHCREGTFRRGREPKKAKPKFTREQMIANKLSSNKIKRATEMVSKAILDGRIQKQDCEVCGEERSHFYHNVSYTPNDYWKIHWLCRAHQALWVKINGELP